MWTTGRLKNRAKAVFICVFSVRFIVVSNSVEYCVRVKNRLGNRRRNNDYFVAFFVFFAVANTSVVVFSDVAVRNVLACDGTMNKLYDGKTNWWETVVGWCAPVSADQNGSVGNGFAIRRVRKPTSNSVSVVNIDNWPLTVLSSSVRLLFHLAKTSGANFSHFRSQKTERETPRINITYLPLSSTSVPLVSIRYCQTQFNTSAWRMWRGVRQGRS